MQYTRLCQAIVDAGYPTLTMTAYLEGKEKLQQNRFVILRHDIDNRVDLPIAARMARFEAGIGISSTWYFRAVKDVFDRELMQEIHELGHEVGYHYEVLNEAEGDIGKAVLLLRSHLATFREVVPVTTICQHGGSLGEHTASTFTGLILTAFKMLSGRLNIRVFRSNDIWQHENFEDFGLRGEAYLSPDFSRIHYFSDTGLRWDGHGSRVLDVVEADAPSQSHPGPRHTRELISIIRKGQYTQLIILAHPANWIDPLFPWLRWKLLQVFRNSGKRLLLKG